MASPVKFLLTNFLCPNLDYEKVRIPESDSSLLPLSFNHCKMHLVMTTNFISSIPCFTVYWVVQLVYGQVMLHVPLLVT
jgi:hypothetical protein